MPAPALVRSYKKSGMNKVSTESDGNVPFQGLPKDYNSTYPANQTDLDRKVPSNIIDLEVADGAPINLEFARRIPDKIEPLGTVSLEQVDQKAK